MEISSSSKKERNEKNTISSSAPASESDCWGEMSFYFSNSNTQFNRLHGNCSYFLMLFCFEYKLAYMAVWYRPREREVTEVWRAEQHGAHGAHGAVQFNIKLAHVLLFVCFLHLHLIQTLLDFSLIHSIARAREFEISKAHLPQATKRCCCWRAC